MQAVNIMQSIQAWREWNSGSADELAAVGTAFLWSLGLEPLPETTASDRISRRTIRYYIGHELMDPPDGERRLATYRYRHLLQLLYIKARQHAGDRLDEIRADLTARSPGEIEAWLAEILPASVPGPVPSEPAEFRRPARLESVLNRWAYLSGRQGRWQELREASPRLLQHAELDQAYGPDGPDPGASGIRHRVELEIEPGIKLDLPADHPLVHDEDGRELVLRGIRRLMRDYHGGPAGREN